MLGLLDLSLLPVNAAEEITLQSGGSSALWGSGAIGGVVGLNNRPDFDNSLSLNSRSIIGSFGNLQQQVQVGIGNARFQSVTKIFHQQAKNDFHYQIAHNLPDRQQTNARFSQQNILQDIYFLAKARQQYSIHFWQQFSEREIPPTNTQTRSEAHQNDRATRLLLSWKQVRKQAVIKSKVGWFKEYLDYYDDEIGQEANSEFSTLTSEVSGQWTWQKKHTFYVGATQLYTQAQADGYLETPRENKSALFASYQWQQSKWQVQFSARQELVDGHFIPLVPVLGMDYQLLSFLSVKGKISRNYRLPTLNDRFWNPGGNTDLKPESGWSEESTLAAFFQWNHSRLDWSLTGFNRKIDNWILWSKKEEQSFWSANNITKVWSRGIEQRISFLYKQNNLTIQWQVGYDFIRSTNQVALVNPKLKKGAQLIYTPKHQAFAKCSVSWKQLDASYQHFYTGASQGINDTLLAYQTGQLRLQYVVERAPYKSTVFFNVNNIWDTDYFVIERRPMPRYSIFLIGISINFKYDTKNNFAISLMKSFYEPSLL